MFRTNAAMVGILTVSSVLMASNLRADEKADLYNEAVRLNDNDQFKEAAEVFRKVQQLDKTFKYHYNVGQCEYKAKRYGPAIESFKKFLEGVHKGKTLKKARKHALEVIKELTPLVGFLKIQGEQSVEVWVDDTLRGTTPLEAPVMVAEGEHTVILKKGDTEIAKRYVRITKGETSTVDLTKGADAEAKAEFARGVALYKSGLYVEASTSFRKANALRPAWTLLFNIGQSEAAAKRYGLAFEAFQDYLAKGGDDISSERQKLVASELARLEDLVGSLEIVAPKGAVVHINGMARGTTPLPGKPKIAVGGIHKIEIIYEGKTIFTKKVKTSRGETTVLSTNHGNGKAGSSTHTISFEASKGDPSKGASTSDAQDKKGRLSPIFWVGLAGTVIFGGVSGAMWGVGASKKNEYEDTVSEINSKMKTWDFSLPEDDQEERTLRERTNNLASETETFNRVAVAMTVLTGACATLAIVGLVIKNVSAEPSQNRVTVGPGGVEVKF